MISNFSEITFKSFTLNSETFSPSKVLTGTSEKLNIKHSYSKKEYPYDYASMESFNSILKKEEVNVSSYKTFNEAKLVLFDFIEGWYNNVRIHSSIGYITTNQKYENYIKEMTCTNI